MPQSFVSLPVHRVFSTKNRAALIGDDMQSRLHEYIGSNSAVALPGRSHRNAPQPGAACVALATPLPLAKHGRPIRTHELAASLLSEGVAEGVVRANYCGVACQIRMDWFEPHQGIVHLKTCDELTWFEADARRFGYGHQVAFYRAVHACISRNSMCRHGRVQQHQADSNEASQRDRDPAFMLHVRTATRSTAILHRSMADWKSPGS